ncbi:hypothetical protein [Streptomyces cyaneofuscatus]
MAGPVRQGPRLRRRSVRTEAFDAMATEEGELAPGVWQETELLL